MNKATIRTVQFASVGVLAIFYVWVAWLAFNPNTSTVYRLYYLDRVLPHWPIGDGLSYAFGAQVEGRHLGRDPSALYLDIGETIPAGLIRLDAVIGTKVPANAPVAATLLVNGHRAGSTALVFNGQRAQLTTQFPATHLVRGINEVILDAPGVRFQGMRMVIQHEQ